MKLPSDIVDLLEFYDRWIKDRQITDKEQKRKIWWAMFYAWKEKREWIDYAKQP